MIKSNYRLFCACLVAMFVFSSGAKAQNNLSEQYAKAMEMFSIAGSISEYREAYNAFKLLEAKMPEEVDIHYRLAVCAEKLAKEDESKYEEAFYQYNSYLSEGEEILDEETKTHIMEKVDDMSYALSIVSKRQVTDYWMQGEWYFNRASGRKNDDYNIRISCSNGKYYAEYKSSVLQSNYWEVLSEEWKRVEMKRSGNTFSFDTEFNNTIVENPGTRKQFEQFKYSYKYHYDLEFSNGDLVGTMFQTYGYAAMGNSRFRTCEEAIARGRGRVEESCSGNCGKSSVYFRKKSDPVKLNIPLDADRRFARAEIALGLARESQDYIEIGREFKEISYLEPDDPTIPYFMGICFQEAFASDPDYYHDAVYAFNTAEKKGAGILEETVLEDIRLRKKSLDEAYRLSHNNNLNIISPEALCGRWSYHDKSGKRESLFDIVIQENHGVYSVQYDSHQSEGGKVSPHLYRDVEVKQEGNTIKFSVVHNRSKFNGNRETYWFKQAMSYELVLLDGKLQGVAHINDIVEAYGHSDYSTVSRAMRDGEGMVIQDKHGDCGTIEVYFTR